MTSKLMLWKVRTEARTNRLVSKIIIRGFEFFWCTEPLKKQNKVIFNLKTYKFKNQNL